MCVYTIIKGTEQQFMNNLQHILVFLLLHIVLRNICTN